MYCNQQDILNLSLDKATLIRLTDDTNEGKVDSAKVDAAIARAQAEIDKYLQGRYLVPFADGSVPALVNGWCAELAAFYLHRTQTGLPASVQRRYDGVKKNVEAIASGKLQLPDASDLKDTGALPVSTTDGQGHKFINDKYDANGKLIDPGTMAGW